MGPDTSSAAESGATTLPAPPAREAVVPEIRRLSNVIWEIPRHGGMRVPGWIFASEELLVKAEEDRAVLQVENVAHLPGIVRASMAMPDIHWGYGFPIGGVAATDVEDGGVVSPGGVGFDICCGVRLLSSGFTLADFEDHREEIMAQLARRIPRGLGKGAIAERELLGEVLERGVPAVLDAGYGTEADLERCEERGTSAGADPGRISDRARQRGQGQLGSLGAGNHFLEVQVVDRVEDPDAARVFGLAEGMITVMIHCGSRGLGHQTCQEQVKLMGPAMAGSRSRTVSWPASRCDPRKARSIWGPWRPRPTSPGPTVTSWPTRPDAPSPTDWASQPKRPGWIWSTTSPTTWPNSNDTRSMGRIVFSVSTARGLPVLLEPVIPTCPKICRR
jgi:hypothetical protein